MKFETILQSHCSVGNDANMFDPCVLQFPASMYPGGVQDKEGCHDDLGLYMSTLPVVYRICKGVMMTLVCEYIIWGVQDRKGGHDGLGLYASTLPASTLPLQDK